MRGRRNRVSYRLRLGDDAEADIDYVLEWASSRFGSPLRDCYEALIGATLTRIACDPHLMGSQDRDDLGTGLRTVHLSVCRNDVSPGVRLIASPWHFVVYRHLGDCVDIIRLLHQAMEITPQHIRVDPE